MLKSKRAQENRMPNVALVGGNMINGISKLRMILFSIFLSLLPACADEHYDAKECRSLAAPKAFVDRCMGGRANGEYIGDLQCWPFSPSKRLHGVWVIRFETSEFFPNATTYERNAKSKIWLENDVEHRVPLLDPAPAADSRAYLVDVAGRLSLCDAWFGHQGNYPRELIVDRIHALHPLPVIPR
jgi:hypothetical protein